eukprot:scaffold9592_cov118-Isochrysis_galbana.AAC.5
MAAGSHARDAHTTRRAQRRWGGDRASSWKNVIRHVLAQHADEELMVAAHQHRMQITRSDHVSRRSPPGFQPEQGADPRKTCEPRQGCARQPKATFESAHEQGGLGQLVCLLAAADKAVDICRTHVLDNTDAKVTRKAQKEVRWCRPSRRV